MKSINHFQWDGTSLKFLDQRVLPEKECYVDCKTSAHVRECIKNMVVRGAPAIGVAAAFALVLAARKLGEDFSAAKHSYSWPAFYALLEKEGAALKETRPTAVNLSWGVERILAKCRSLKEQSLEILLGELEQEALTMYNEDIEVNKKIGARGAELVKENSIILTHCNAGALATAGYGTALGIIRSAFSRGKKITVYVDETRPFLQGARLTAWELQKEGIPVTVIVDSAAGYFMYRGDIDCVIVGADRVAANGDVANKIGTYSLAVLAKENNIPFFVAAPVSTIDLSIASGKEIIVEERDAEEITHFKGLSLTPTGLEVKNPSFDITPACLITALVTEMGVLYFPDKKKLQGLMQKNRKKTSTNLYSRKANIF